jgi:predicted nucleotidyltransferase
MRIALAGSRQDVDRFALHLSSVLDIEGELEVEAASRPEWPECNDRGQDTHRRLRLAAKVDCRHLLLTTGGD